MSKNHRISLICLLACLAVTLLPPARHSLGNDAPGPRELVNPLSPKPAGSPEETLFSAAQQHFQARRYLQALELSTRFLLAYPNSPHAPQAEQYWVLSRVRRSEGSTAPGQGQLRESADPGAEGVQAAPAPAPLIVPGRENLHSSGATGGRLLSLDLRTYLSAVLDLDPSHRIDRAEFSRMYAASAATLMSYGWNLSLDPGAVAYYDRGVNYGADLTANLSRTLYDGGRKRALESELEIVRRLSDASLVDSGNRAVLLALNLYASFYTLQQEVSLLGRNLAGYQELLQGVELSYQKGTRLSPYDYFSAKSQLLNLERELIDRKGELLKAETAFRQYGKIYTGRQIDLRPLSLPGSVELDNLENEALVHNSSIRSARLQRDLQLQKVEETASRGGVTVRVKSSLGLQVGSSDYLGTSNSFGAGTKPVATVGVNASIPLWDGGVRRSNLVVEEIEALKQKLLLEKTTEEVVRKLAELRLDYLALEKDREINGELVELNRKRFQIARDRFDRGLEPYRSVQEALNDTARSEIERLRQTTLLQKLLLDMAVLSGRSPVDL